jgi:hypothetical protein
MRSKKIVIANVYSTTGGALVLSALCSTLRQLGYDATVLMLIRSSVNSEGYANFVIPKGWLYIKCILRNFINQYFPESLALKINGHMTWVRGMKYKQVRKVDENDIVIYPEIIYGNPCGVRDVVRWFLYHNRFPEGTDAYGKNDLFITYRDVFNDNSLNPENRKVKLAFFDHQLYRQYNFGERKGNCYILRKGRIRNDIPSSFDGPVFDSDITEKEVVKMFNTYKYCYCYDTQTFYAKIAAICGCITIVVMEEGKTEKDYLASGENHWGVAYGNTPEQIEYALSTREKLLNSLDFTESNKRNASYLVQLLEEHFGSIKRIKEYPLN